MSQAIESGYFGRPATALPIHLDIREVLTVNTCRALVGAALGIGVRQNILAADLVVQGVECRFR